MVDETDIKQADPGVETPAFLQRFAQRVQETPDVALDELVDVSDEELKAMPPEEYERFMQFIGDMHSERLLVQYVPHIISKFIQTKPDDIPVMQALLPQIGTDLAVLLSQHTSFTDNSGNQTTTSSMYDIASPLYDIATNPHHPLNRYTLQTIPSLVILDNKKEGKHDLLEKLGTDTKRLLLSADTRDVELGNRLSEVIWGHFSQDELAKLAVSVLIDSTDMEKQKELFTSFANKLTDVALVTMLRDLALTSDPQTEARINQIFKNTGYLPEHGTISSVEQIYGEHFDIATYDANEKSLVHEVQLILTEMKDAQVILDLPCGSGRHLLELMKHGKTVYGIDIVQKYIDHIKNLNPQALVQQGGMESLPFPPGMFDGVYSLGRSFQHMSDSVKWIQTLKNIGIVLKDNGKLLIDAPSREGYVGARINELNANAQELGIVSHEEGFVVGSPDNAHFFDRYFPDDELFIIMGELAGFRVEKIEELRYTDHTGKPNVNVYWRLTKQDLHLSAEEKIKKIVKIRHLFPPISIAN